MKVSFIFCNATTWWKLPGAALIRWADSSPANHMAIMLETYTGQNVYESVIPKSRKISTFAWGKEYSVVQTFTFEVPAHLHFIVREWLESQVGKKYSISQLALIALTVLAPVNKLLNWSILNHDKYLICTELCSRFMEEFMGLQVKESHDKISVSDMIRICKENYNKEYIQCSNVWKLKGR